MQAGGETMTDVEQRSVTGSGEQENGLPHGLSRPKRGNLQLCQSYRTISLISHLSKVMLKVILNRLKLQAEEIIVEEHTGFRARRSFTEQIFNLRILWEKSAKSVPCLHLTEYGMQPYGPPCKSTSTISVQI